MTYTTREFLLQWAKRRRDEAESEEMLAKGEEDSAREHREDAATARRMADELEALAQTVPGNEP